MRYLVVYSSLGWQIIDSKKNCEIVDHGTKDAMVAKAQFMNEEHDKFIANGGTVVFK